MLVQWFWCDSKECHQKYTISFNLDIDRVISNISRFYEEKKLFSGYLEVICFIVLFIKQQTNILIQCSVNIRPVSISKIFNREFELCGYVVHYDLRFIKKIYDSLVLNIVFKIIQKEIF